MTRRPPGSGTASEKRSGWAAPYLLAGRAHTGLVLAGVLILAGALTDTLAFKSTLELVLRTKEWTHWSWAMAVGATAMALVAAGCLGIAVALRRRGGQDQRLAVILTATVWLGLGTAMFLVRWRDTANASGPSFTNAAAAGHPAPWIAIFFAAIYLISGVCTWFEAERLYNPEYFAFVRLGKQYRKQAAQVAQANATVDRARSAVDHHAGELDREDYRRLAAIGERQALGAQAASHARILMAGMLRDPAKTSLTEAGPVPAMRALLAPSPEFPELPPSPPESPEPADRDGDERGAA
jgi:hypothetical protein